MNATTVFALLALIIPLGTVIWVAAQWAQKVNTSVLDISGIKESIKTLTNQVNRLSNKIDKMCTSSLVEEKSPLALSKKGAEVAKRLGAEDTVKLFVDEIKVKKDASPFVIQEASEEFVYTEMMDRVPPDVRVKIEDVAYENGGNIGNVLAVYSILLRDKILGSRPDLLVPKHRKKQSKD